MKKYIVVYREHDGSFKKKIAESGSDFSNCAWDIANYLEISIDQIISIVLDTNPEVEE